MCSGCSRHLSSCLLFTHKNCSIIQSLGRAHILLCAFYSFYTFTFYLLLCLLFTNSCSLSLTVLPNLVFAICTIFCTILQGGKFIGESSCEVREVTNSREQIVRIVRTPDIKIFSAMMRLIMIVTIVAINDLLYLQPTDATTLAPKHNFKTHATQYILQPHCGSHVS